MSKKLKIIISGGGTGGHIFPAISIAKSLEKIRPDIDILFVGSNGGMEMEKVPSFGYKIKGLEISGLSRSSIVKNISLPMKILKSVNRSKEIIDEFKPDVIVGVGGYASGPILYAGINKHIPTLIQEQNSYPGITNRILGKRVDKICVSYNGMEKYFPIDKLIMTGNPIRQDIIDIEFKRNESFRYFNLEENKPTILVIGDSLGAETINESIKNSLPLFLENDIQLIWQTVKSFYVEAIELTKKYSNIKVYDFISRMDYAYAASDVVISRAGALSISEICMVGKPSILIPSPNVTDDHQSKNADRLVKSNSAIVIKDENSIRLLGNEIIKLIKDKNLRESLSKNIKYFSISNSSELIAQGIIKLSRK